MPEINRSRVIKEKALRIFDVAACCDLCLVQHQAVEYLTRSQEDCTKRKCSSKLLPEILAAKVHPHAGSAGNKLPGNQLDFQLWSCLRSLFRALPLYVTFKVLFLLQIFEILTCRHNT